MKEDNSLWWNGPTWLKEQDSWPSDIITVASPESNAEAKASKQIFAITVESNDVMDELLLRSSLWRTLRVGAWVARFLRNNKSPRNQRIKGQLTTEGIQLTSRGCSGRRRLKNSGRDLINSRKTS